MVPLKYMYIRQLQKNVLTVWLLSQVETLISTVETPNNHSIQGLASYATLPLDKRLCPLHDYM